MGDFLAPPTLHAAFGGFDVMHPPDASAEQKIMRAIYNTTNLDFVGHYLSHKPLGKDIGWHKVLPTLVSQGWGIVFFYVGYSQKSWPDALYRKEKAGQNISREVRELGRQHAKLAKERAAALKHEGQGAFVFVDNEDGSGIRFLPSVLEYYQALFGELMTWGEKENDPPPVRCGLYVRNDPFPPLVSMMPELGVLFWFCEEHGIPNVKKDWKKGERIMMPIEKQKLKSLTYIGDRSVPKPVPNRTGLFMGWQWYLEREEHPRTVILPQLTIKTDYDVCLVRDPRYPEADPRIAVWDDIQLRGVYCKTDASMHLQQVYRIGPKGVNPPDIYALDYEEPTNEELFEPDGPIILMKSLSENGDVEIFTINKEGLIVSVIGKPDTVEPGSWKWSRPSKLISSSYEMRRNRAVAVIKRKNETQVFFAASNYTVMGIRRTTETSMNRVTITVARPLADRTIVHPFSSIAAIAPDDDNVNIFFLDKSGYLQMAWWTSKESTVLVPQWPSTHHRLLQSAQYPATLLPFTSIAVASPTEDNILVFAVGKNQLLHMATSAGDNWFPLLPLPGLKDTDSRLFHHTRLSTLVLSPTMIMVAALTEINWPCIYVLVRDRSVGGRASDSWNKTENSTALAWRLHERLYLPHPEQREAYKFDLPQQIERGGAKWAIAHDFSINPFGDLVLSVLDGEIVLWAVGQNGMKRVMMYRKVITRKAAKDRKLGEQMKTVWMYVT